MSTGVSPRQTFPAAASTSAPIQSETVALLSAGVPAATRQAYARDRREWVSYAAWRQRPALPVPPELLEDYVAHLLTAATKPRPLAASSVERRLSAISTLSVETGHGRPDLRAARLALRGHRRSSPQRVRQAAPITVPVLRALVAQTAAGTGDATSTLRGHRDRAIVLLGFALGARRSELVALDLPDLHEDPAGLRVAVRRAKTSDRTAEVAVPWAGDPALCPVRATLGYRAALAGRAIADGPLFRRITRTDAVLPGRLSGQSVATVVARLADAAGVPVPDGFAGWSAHSLRRGMATEARRGAADPLRIARQGGWADNSAALATYLVDVDRWENHPLSGVL